MGFKAESTERDATFAELIANKICGGHNQNSIILFNGVPGSGKSLAALRLAYDLSLMFADRLSTPTKKYIPTDFFTLDNVAVLTASETIRVVKNIKQFQITIIDDAGAEAMSARGWQSKQNQVMVKLLQTFRSLNGVLLISTPSSDVLDKIARGLIQYRVFMIEKHFEHGFTLGKLSTVKRVYTKDGGSNLYPFLRTDSKIYNYCRFNLPPTGLRTAYELKRKMLERQMNLKTISDMEEEVTEETAKSNGTKLKEASNKDVVRKTHAVLYKSLVKSGVKSEEALRRAAEATGLELSQRTVIRDYNRLVLEVDA